MARTILGRGVKAVIPKPGTNESRVHLDGGVVDMKNDIIDATSHGGRAVTVPELPRCADGRLLRDPVKDRRREALLSERRAQRGKR